MRAALSNLTDEQVRRMAAGLGLSLALFGAVSAIAPQPFAWLFGMRQPDPEMTSMYRSIGVRDVAMGMGVWSAAVHGGNYAPWLLARIIADGGDSVGVGIAVAQGQRHPRFIGLGGLALAAAAADTVLWLLARQTQPE